MVFDSIMFGILQTWMVKAGLGVVGGADSVDWQDEPQEVSGEEEVAAVRTGNQVDREHYKDLDTPSESTENVQNMVPWLR